MGQLKPGATYIYESPDGGETVYARESGAPISDRILIGQSYKALSLQDQLKQDQLWGQIRRLAKTNTALQAELDRVIMFYYLCKDQENNTAYHPV
jgi:hypothetical protein